jgi:hypothetical protein
MGKVCGMKSQLPLVAPEADERLGTLPPQEKMKP